MALNLLYSVGMVVSALPLLVFTVLFRDAIPLRDPATDQRLDQAWLAAAGSPQMAARPQWVRDRWNDPAAYVRGSSRVQLEVVFLLQNENIAELPVSIHAYGPYGNLPRQRMAWQVMDSGLSAPVSFRLDAPLPAQIGVHEFVFEWFATFADERRTLSLGETRHLICTTWQAFTPDPAQELYDWVYQPLLLWSCRWAAGQNSPREICDALMAHLPQCGLTYGLVGSYTVRSLLLRGSGMCAAWSRFFQQLAHCQGITLARRCLTIVAVPQPRQQQWWHALVIKSPGLNQRAPQAEMQTFYDVDARFPPPSGEPTPVSTTTEPRYVFAGWPREMVGVQPASHCLNFLQEEDGGLLLYDPSFGWGPYALAPLPHNPGDFVSDAALADLKAVYLDEAVDYLLGSVENGAELYQTAWLGDPPQPVDGLCVKTSLIPAAAITIAWTEN